MLPLDPPPCAPALPPITTIVLSQIARLRFGGVMPDTVFRAQIARIIHEELDPRGFVLLVRELAGGRIRFLVKAANTGRVCQLVEYPPEEVSEPDEVAMPGRNVENQITETVFDNDTLHAWQ
jgi:hypothetical protein